MLTYTAHCIYFKRIVTVYVNSHFLYFILNMSLGQNLLLGEANKPNYTIIDFSENVKYRTQVI